MDYAFLGKTIASIVLISFGTLYLGRTKRKYSFDDLLIVACLVVFSLIIGNKVSYRLMALYQKENNSTETYIQEILSYVFSAILVIVLVVMVNQIRRGKYTLWWNNNRPAPITYGRDDALALKGIAILIMLFHHLFLKGRFDGYSIAFAPFSEKQITDIANYCKVCVSLYAFVSGYGLYLSYSGNRLSDKKWIACRYIKTFSGFWIVVVLSWIVCQIIDGRTALIYIEKNRGGSGVVNMFLDFLGLACLCGTKSICGTWWYMSAAFLFILMTPLVARRGNSISLACIAVFVFIRVIAGGKMSEYYNTYLGGSTPFSYLMPFLIGALFAKKNLINRLINAPHRWLRFLIELILLMGTYILYLKISTSYFFDIKWGLLPLPLILFCVEYVIPRRSLRPILVFLGKHSMNIFLTHTFIRGTYLQDTIYSFHHFLISFLVLLFISLALSLLIEWIKKTLRYHGFIDTLCKRIAR